MKANVILADPPWQYAAMSGQQSGTKGGSAATEYSMLKSKELAALPVNELASDDCVLYLWATTPYIVNGQAIALAEAWGFRVTTQRLWVKTTNAGGVHLGGIGRAVKNAHETLLVCTRGTFRPWRYETGWTPEDSTSVFLSPRRQHSRKPDYVYDFIERSSYAPPRVELFARTHSKGVKLWEPRPGWRQIGNEFEETMGEDIRDSLERLIKE